MKYLLIMVVTLGGCYQYGDPEPVEPVSFELFSIQCWDDDEVLMIDEVGAYKVMLSMDYTLNRLYLRYRVGSNYRTVDTMDSCVVTSEGTRAFY